MVRICFITTVHETLQSFVLKSAEYLHDNADYDISLICNPNEEFQASLPEYIHFIPVPMARGISMSGVGALFELIKIFCSEKYDMVQYSTPNASFYAAIAAKIARIPVRLYCQWGIAYVGFKGIKRRIFKSVEKIVCRLSTWVEPDSYGNLTFSHAEGLYPDTKGSVIWNGSASGVDLQKFDVSKKAAWRTDIRSKYNIPKDAFVYGFVGRITGDKGINELFEAFQKISKDQTNVYMMLVGNTEKMESINQDLFRWAQEEQRVIFCGYSKTVEQYLAAMDVYILPSYREGFGSGVIEAEAMAVPVIVTDIPGPTDAMVRDKTGFVVLKADVKSLQSAMMKILESGELQQKFGEAGKRYATENFEQKRLFSYILEDRQQLLSGR